MLALLLIAVVSSSRPAVDNPKDIGLEVTVDVRAHPVFRGWRQFQVLDPDGRPIEVLDASGVSLGTCVPDSEAGGVRIVGLQKADRPVALSVVLDCSRSMSGTPSRLARALVASLLRQMRGSDRLRILAFNDSVASSGFLTAGDWRMVALLARLRELERSPRERRPSCLTDRPTGSTLEEWASQCSVDELGHLIDEQLPGIIAGRLPTRGIDDAGPAVSEAFLSTIRDHEGFIPAYDAVTGIVIVSDFRILAAPPTVIADCESVRSAFLVRQWNVTTSAPPMGVPAADATIALSASTLDAESQRIVHNLRTVYEIEFEASNPALLRPRCIRVEYARDGTRMRVVQPDEVMPPRDALRRAWEDVEARAARGGVSSSAAWVLDRLLRTLRTPTRP